MLVAEQDTLCVGEHVAVLPVSPAGGGETAECLAVFHGALALESLEEGARDVHRTVAHELVAEVLLLQGGVGHEVNVPPGPARGVEVRGADCHAQCVH